MVLTFNEYNVIDAAERCREEPEAGAEARGPGILASVPGGLAYDQVMKMIRRDADKGTDAATVWFAEMVVYGQYGPDGWVHPFGHCGRDDVPVPENPRERMWDSEVEGAHGKHEEPEVGRKYKCWCCRWLDLTDSWHEAGFQLYCCTSNIWEPEWVKKYGAGSSELPDERFRSPKPAGWGKGTIICEGSAFSEAQVYPKLDREAVPHPDTGKPLGQGCRWERQCLEAKDYEVRCFFLP